MLRFWTYIFSLFFLGSLGLYIEHLFHKQEVSLLKQWIACIPIGDQKLIVLNVMKPSDVGKEAVKKNEEVVHEDEDYMKQIAHVRVPQDALLSDVSKPSLETEVQEQEMQMAYKEHLAHISDVLREINHAEKSARMLARLELAQLRVAGPLSNYMQQLVTSLLVRYCSDEGKLLHTDFDEHVVSDITKALALIKDELDADTGSASHEGVDFTQVQRRVQRHAYNSTLKKVLADA